jgi:hypothetical protein
MKRSAVTLTLASLLAAYTPFATAQCDALIRDGVFDYRSLASDDLRIESFRQWARDRRGQQSGSAGSGNVGLSIPDILKLDVSGSSSKSSNFWQDVENFNSSDSEQRARLLTYARTASETLVQGLNQCLRIKGLHVWLETTARSDTFRIAANFNSPGDPKSATIESVTVVPKSPLVECTREFSENAVIGGATRRLTCVRRTCEGVSVTINASVDPLGGGSLSLPPQSSCGTPVPAAPNVLEMIQSGSVFAVYFGQLQSNVGTILPGRTLTGVYSHGERAWRVWGPNGASGRLLPQGSNEGLYGCGSVVPGGNRDTVCFEPRNGFLNLWGAVFRFNQKGEVFMFDGKEPIGSVSVQR